MSRKNLLNLIQVDAGTPFKGAASDNTLVGQVASTMREEKARQARADEIERRLAAGQSVIELDAALVEPSFVSDRMPGEIDGLVASIRDQGQQVPILVRPHPEASGRYQVAFGHRRLRALKALGLPVKAVVRALSDEQLVIAQGQENNERQDLSYIEKARFAQRLRERFARDVITAAMSIDKTELSRMLSIVDAIPAELIEAIGPAPGIGRRSWQELSDILEKTDPAAALQRLRTDEMQERPSQDRFKALLAVLKPKNAASRAPDVLTTSSGRRLGHVRQSASKIEIILDRKDAADFAAFLLTDAIALFEEHRATINATEDT